MVRGSRPVRPARVQLAVALLAGAVGVRFGLTAILLLPLDPANPAWFRSAGSLAAMVVWGVLVLLIACGRRWALVALAFLLVTDEAISVPDTLRSVAYLPDGGVLFLFALTGVQAFALCLLFTRQARAWFTDSRSVGRSVVRRSAVTDEDTLVLRPTGLSPFFTMTSRRFLLLLVAFVVLGLAEMATGDRVDGWVYLALALLFLAAGLLQRLPKISYLKLTPEGFAERHLFQSRSLVRWQDVEQFIIGHANWAWWLGLGLLKWVAFNFVPAYAERSTREKLVRRWFGYDRSLLHVYGRSPDELAELLNQWRARHS